MAVEINGDGLITVDGTTSTQGRVRLKEDADNGSNYVELTAPASVTANRTITFPDDTGTVLTNSGNQTGVFSALTVNSNNISADNSLGFRNRIINGAMVIDQRNAGASNTAVNDVYYLDRFVTPIASGLAGSFSIQRSTTAPAGFTNSLFITSLAASTVGASHYALVWQKVEGFNIADLGWGTASAKAVTVSFWVRSSLTGSFGGGIENSAQARSYPFLYTISSANTWEYKTVTIPGDTTGTWETGNGTGLILLFSMGAGSNFLGTPGQWNAAQNLGATGQTNLVATNGATWYITGVQLEVGSVATPFERRPYGTELMLCQRYCYVMGVSGATVNQRFFISGNASGTNAFPMRAYPVTLRASPSSMTVSNVGHFTFETWASLQQTCTGLVLNVATENEITVTATVGSSLATGGNILANNTAAKITINAEL